MYVSDSQLIGILETELLPWFATHTLEPSNTTATGVDWTGNVPKMLASLPRNLVTLLLPLFATHMFVPSNAMPSGFDPTWTPPDLCRRSRAA